MDDMRKRIEAKLAAANRAADRAAMALEFLAGRTNGDAHKTTIGLTMAAIDHAHEGRLAEALEILDLLEV